MDAYCSAPSIGDLPASAWAKPGPHFSYWMTSMLHSVDGASGFDQRRQPGDLESVVGALARVDQSRRGLHRLAHLTRTAPPSAVVSLLEPAALLDCELGTGS